MLAVAAMLAAACGSDGAVELSAASPDVAAVSDAGSAAEPTDPSASGSGSGSGGDGSGRSDGSGSAAGDDGETRGNGEEPDAGYPDDGNGEADADDGTNRASGESIEPDAGADTPLDGPTAPLTGLLTSDFSLAERRALAVKVDNTSPRSRPQIGLGSADVVYEALIEGGKTRFLAVFHSNIPTLIGPVRSARSTDIALVADLSSPYLASSGANSGVLGELRRAHDAGTLVDISGLRTSEPYTRVDDRPAPYNFFLHYPSLEEGTPASVEPLFEYGSNPPATNPPGTERAAGVTVAYHRGTGTVVSHIWDAGLGGWVRIHGGKLHTVTGDLGPSEAAPANVVVVFVPYSTSPADPESPKAETLGSGDALVLTAGSVHRGRWERTADLVGFRFTDASGGTLRLSPGSTWVLLANTSGRFPVSRVTQITVSEAADLLAEARAAAEAAGNDAGAS